MTVARLNIDLGAVRYNWTTLARHCADSTETGAVVKADAYGLGADRVCKALAEAGARTFFVAAAEEAVGVRQALGDGPVIYVFSGYGEEDYTLVNRSGAVPLLNSPEQLGRYRIDFPDRPFGLQLDTGMNRLGMEAAQFIELGEQRAAASLIASHLACAEQPEHEFNAVQLACFRALTDALPVRRSLAATAGMLLGPEYHFDLTRPGIGLYGGAPFSRASAVVTCALPVLQIRTVQPGEHVGYAGAWCATETSTIATAAAGYADGIIRAAGKSGLNFYANGIACPMVGRVSMDLVTVDVTHLPEIPSELELLSPQQGIDQVAAAAGTIAHEVLTSLGARSSRHYLD